MTREEALVQWQNYHQTVFESYQLKFWEELTEKKQQLEDGIHDGIKRLKEKIVVAGKQDIVHLQFSLLRIDLISRKYTILLGAYDVEWYMDDAPVEVTFQIDFLFESLNALWDKALQESKKYIGKVNAYDVNHLVMEEILQANKLIAHAVRFILKEVEALEAFKEIPKAPYWVIRWGEYRDQSEIILQVDRYPKVEKDWLEAIDEIRYGEDRLICSYWYEGNFSKGDVTHKLLHFIGFEACQLKEINFEGAALLGARFKACQLEDCSFKGALLKFADFRNTQFKNVDFTDADVTGAIFLEEVVPYLHLSPDQLQLIEIERS